MLERICTWPNGEARSVIVTSVCIKDATAKILWNEPVNSVNKAVTGFEDTVPISWLKGRPSLADPQQTSE